MNGRTRDRSALVGWPDDHVSDLCRDDPERPRREPPPPSRPGVSPGGDGTPGTRDPQAGSWDD